MKRTFLRLRGELQARDIDTRYLGQELDGMSEYSVNRRLRGEVPWGLNEMYAIMNLLDWPSDHMHELFPNNVCSCMKNARPTYHSNRA